MSGVQNPSRPVTSHALHCSVHARFTVRQIEQIRGLRAEDVHDVQRRNFALAAMHGLLAVVQRLLREGANRQLRDSLGRTPYDLALLRGYVDIASEFEPARPPPSLARFLREPR